MITYVCIKLHNNNFRPVVWLWKPFHRHFAHFRRSWDSTASIINAFTTFLLLSFSKILFVSFTLLYTFPLRYNYDNIPTKCALYYDSTVECHTQECTIFSAIGGCVLVIFIICPTILLILYPTRLFRKCVSNCEFRRWHALHMFVESFQGQYKDGTNGAHDFRMVSASFLVLRIMILAFFLNHHRLLSDTSILQGAVFACASSMHAVTRPYKLNFMNIVDIVILLLLELLMFATSSSRTPLLAYIILGATLLLLVPHMVLIFFICHKLANKMGITQSLKRRYISLKRGVQATRPTSEDLEAESDTGSLPDRLINQGVYEPVLPTTDERTAVEPTEDKELDNKEPRRSTLVYTYGSISK